MKEEPEAIKAIVELENLAEEGNGMIANFLAHCIRSHIDAQQARIAELEAKLGLIDQGKRAGLDLKLVETTVLDQAHTLINLKEAEIARLSARVKAAEEMANDGFEIMNACQGYVEGEIDVVDGEYGEPEPNKAMRLNEDMAGWKGKARAFLAGREVE